MPTSARTFLLLAAVLVVAKTDAAEPLAMELESATIGFDQRAGEPVLNIRLAGLSKRIFAIFSGNNVGRKMQLRVDDNVLYSGIIREPLLGGSFQLSGISLEKAQSLADALSKPGIKVEVDDAAD